MTLRARGIALFLSATGLAACGSAGEDAPVPLLEPTGTRASSLTPACTGSSAWGTYGHDARRSSASDGCVWYPLAPAWSYAPTAASPRVMQTVERAVADTGGVYVKWDSSGNYSNSRGTPAVDKVSLAGAKVWSADKPLNDNRGNWPTLFTYEKEVRTAQWETRDGVVLNDDGIRIWNKASGPVYYPGNPLPYSDVELHSNDSWGQSLTDGTRLWIYNQEAWHGPRLGLRAFTRRGAVERELNTYGYYPNAPSYPAEQWNTAQDNFGAIAADGGFIYLAAIYNFQCSTQCNASQPWPFTSGLYGWDIATGVERWPAVALTPASHLSVAGNRIYLLERDATTGQVTFNIRNGGYKGSSLFRSAPFPSSALVSVQAPVLVGGRAIVATQESAGTVLYSFDAISGGTPVTRTLSGVYGIVVDAYGMELLAFTTPRSAKRTTTLAAASGTRDDAGTGVPTLVITSSSGLHVLRVSDLAQQWSASKSTLVGAVDGSSGGQLRDPIIVGKRVYTADQNKLYAFDAP
ncbi:hypothetical protein [Pyxidicoccus trucidator]|uniref:hypothetical protein n=1 Tax=Pyxidicoccus trucidator TaxID=2709662 RepID=UPI0013DD4868|nr:hypothetical protein [Pyxidicoccus trucidator]